MKHRSRQIGPQLSGSNLPRTRNTMRVCAKFCAAECLIFEAIAVAYIERRREMAIKELGHTLWHMPSIHYAIFNLHTLHVRKRTLAAHKVTQLTILHLPSAHPAWCALEQLQFPIHALVQSHWQVLHQRQEPRDALGIHVVPLPETNRCLAPAVATQAAELF